MEIFDKINSLPRACADVRTAVKNGERVEFVEADGGTVVDIPYAKQRVIANVTDTAVLGIDIPDGFCLVGVGTNVYDIADAASPDWMAACERYVFGGEAPSVPDADIRLLTEAHAHVVSKYYRDGAYSVEEVVELMHMPRREIYGVFEGDALCGFIGRHHDGAMGMLHVLDDYRRKGYAYALETFLIRKVLEWGEIPFCDVIDGNDASTALQKRIGMTDVGSVIWYGKRD